MCIYINIYVYSPPLDYILQISFSLIEVLIIGPTTDERKSVKFPSTVKFLIKFQEPTE